MDDPAQGGRVKKSLIIPRFAPADPTDGRELLDWRSRYTDPVARRGIRVEAAYLVFLLIIIPIVILILWLEYPRYWLGISEPKYKYVLKYGMAWLSGVFGGTLFDVKWLYHSVARQVWHLDRRLWRLFTPLISGGLAFAVVALISSGILRVFDRQAIKSLSLVVGVAFLVGYFSDSAVAKLTEIAETLFGASREKEKHKEQSRLNAGVATAEREESKPSESFAGEIVPPNSEDSRTE